MKPTKQIEDYHTVNRRQKQELNQMARIQLASGIWGNSVLSSMKNEELTSKLSSINDEDVQTYLNKLENEISSSRSETHSHREFISFFEAFGFTPLESSSLTNHLKDNYHVNSLYEVNKIDERSLRAALSHVLIILITIFNFKIGL
jgi:hypothetical protein